MKVEIMIYCALLKGIH